VVPDVTRDALWKAGGGKVKEETTEMIVGRKTYRSIGHFPPRDLLYRGAQTKINKAI
jgi:hypothetical protein